MTILPVGDAALCVEFGEGIHPEINALVRGFRDSLMQRPPRGVLECVPSFRSLLVLYDPCKTGYDRLVRLLRKREKALVLQEEPVRQICVIPVCYDGEDLQAVAAHGGISPKEVVQRHCAPDYFIYMLGFLPGFAYLGGLDPAIHTPRLQNPRLSIPAGSVGIGGEQTGIYPLASPGGWQLIGRTAVRPYRPDRTPPILYQPGDYIRFFPVDEAELARLEQTETGGAQWLTA